MARKIRIVIESNMTLEGKTIIKTGGTHGIGEETPLLFASKWEKVTIVGRDGKKTSAIVRQSNGRIEFLQCN